MKEAGGFHHGQELLPPLKAEYIGADHKRQLRFRLQSCGGPYIRIRADNAARTRKDSSRCAVTPERTLQWAAEPSIMGCGAAIALDGLLFLPGRSVIMSALRIPRDGRSEERRVGKEGRS